MGRINVGILGGSGYSGGELLRLLLFHPIVQVKLVTSNTHAGRRVDAIHPHLRHMTDLVFSQTIVSDELAELDCVFLALPHGESQKLISTLPDGLKVIDLAGDFRLKDEDEFEHGYGQRHIAPDLLHRFEYGLTEINREAISQAEYVANPGCFATAVLIGLTPLIASHVTRGKIIVDAKTGSSGSGAKPAAHTHHPSRANSFFAYKAFAHQHLPEVTQMLRAINPKWQDGLVLQAHSAPLVRGIFASIYCTLESPLSPDQVGEIFRQYYNGCFFVRLVGKSPDVNWVKNTNFADVGWAVSGTDVIVFVAIDNLVKGAAGQAVQNMNLMFCFEEETGLILPGSHP